MRSIQRNKWFTFVELLVVMMILIILWVIAFISFQSYLKSARDSWRTSNLKDIETSFDVFAISHAKYPQPSNPVAISYSGVTVWEQWTIWESVISQLEQFNEIPLDPLTEKEYTYSRLNTKQEYEIAAAYERDNLAGINAWNTTYANGGQLAVAYVRWNYNGMVAKVTVASTVYVLALPTIISADLSETDLMHIINNNKLAYKWYNNLASSYTDTKLNVLGWFNYSPSPFILYSWLTLPSWRWAIQWLVYNIQQVYSWSTFWNNKWIQEIVEIETSDIAKLYEVWSLIVIDNLKWTVWELSHWSDIDKYCTKDDIVLWSQVWAACNSTLWWGSAYELGGIVDYVDCWNYNWWVHNIGGALCYSGAIWAFNWTEKAYMEIILSASGGVNSNWDVWVDNIWWKLYNWTTKKSACHSWYHIPSDDEWKVLERYLWCPESNLDTTVSNDNYNRCSWLGWYWHSWTGSETNIINALGLPASWYKTPSWKYGYARGTSGYSYYWTSTLTASWTEAYKRWITFNSRMFNRFEGGGGDYNIVRCIAD